MNSEELAELILDSLIDGAASFAVIHQQLRSRATLDVAELVANIRKLEEAGLLESWDVQEDGSTLRSVSEEHWGRAVLIYTSHLATASGDDRSDDEFGPWIQLTEHGRSKWQRSNPSDVGDDWSIQDLEERQIVVVEGNSYDHMEQALKRWLAYRGDVELSNEVSTPADLERSLGNGGVLRVSYKYRLKRSS